MNNNGIDQDIFECKIYITDLETNKNSKEINITDLIFDDNLEFEFGNYEDEDYSQLPYKDFKFFINDYSVTFYSPQYHKLQSNYETLNNRLKELEQINEEHRKINGQLMSNWDGLREFFEMIPNYYMDKKSNNNGVYIQEGMERFRNLALDKMNELEGVSNETR